MSKENLIKNAIEIWERCAFENSTTDFLINDALEKLCKQTNTAYFGDNIDLTIRNLSNSNKRKFIKIAKGIWDNERNRR